MKYLVTILLGCLLISAVSKEDYCDGWKKGYEAGYCYEVQNCIKPIVPVCPIPKLNEKSFQDGYNRGFTVGKSNKK